MAQNYWVLDQQNLIVFVLVDSSGAEVSGLGTGFTLEISKAGGAFNASAGVKAEISDGWYSYLCTAGEADTVGPIAIKVTHASVIQQNLIYVILQRSTNLIEFTYTLTEPAPGLAPIEGATVWFATDVTINNIVWQGVTDTFGVARDQFGNKPLLQAGTYYVQSQKSGYSFEIDTEVVS